MQQLSVPLGDVRSSSRGTSVSLRHLRHLYSVFISEFVFICLFVLIFWFGSCRCVLVPSTLSISLALPINLRFILFLFFFSVSQSVTTEFVSL